MLRKETSDLLQELAKRCKDAKERERLRALYAVSVGYPLPTVAEIFSVDEGTIYRWIERWREERKLSDKPKRGRPESLSEEDREILIELLIEGEPREHGVDADFWNTKELMEYFSSKGKRVSQETIRRCLKKMGAKYVKGSKEDLNVKDTGIFTKRFIEDMKYNPHLLAILLEDSTLGCPKKSCGWTIDKKIKMKAVPKKVDGEDEFEEPLGKKKELKEKEEKKLEFIKLSKKE